jgi:arsenate reductase (thioredoxin)
MRMTATVVVLLVTATVAAQSPPQTVLFVCEHGAAKSVVAAAQFNKLAAERGLPFRAVSRGTMPDPAVPSLVSDGLTAAGFSVPAGFSPTLVTSNDVAAAVRVVAFDVSLPASARASHVSRWDGLPAFSDGYGPASAAISDKVNALLRELETAAKKK